MGYAFHPKFGIASCTYGYDRLEGVDYSTTDNDPTIQMVDRWAALDASQIKRVLKSIITSVMRGLPMCNSCILCMQRTIRLTSTGWASELIIFVQNLSDGCILEELELMLCISNGHPKPSKDVQKYLIGM